MSASTASTASDPQGETLADDIERQIRNQQHAGVVLVISESRVHWRLALDAPWNALSYDAESGELRIRVKQRDFRTAEQAQRTLDLTAHTVFQTCDLMLTIGRTLEGFAAKLVQQIEVEHEPGQDFRPSPGSRGGEPR